MRPCPVFAGAGLLLRLALLGLAGCSSPSAEERAICANVVCTAGECQVDDGQPRCVCGARERAEQRTCAIRVIYVYDGNDTPDTATPLAVPTAPSPASIDPSRVQLGDTDVYTFTGAAGHIYRFTCGAGTLTGCSVRLTGPDGSLLDSRSGALGQDVAVQGVSSLEGIWYAAVSAANRGGLGTYTYQLDDLGVDDYGDALATATPLGVNAPMASGRFDGPEDVDVFSFEAQSGHSYYFGCAPATDSLACKLTLKDDAGRVLLLETQEGTSSSLRFRADASAIRFVSVGAVAAGAIGAYRYILEDYGPDDFGDTPATASPVMLPAAFAGRIDVTWDRDVFTFPGTGGHLYRARCADETGVGCNLTLRSASGARLAGPAAAVQATAPTDGPLYLELGNSVLPGLYGLTLEDLGEGG